jgi:hypothetical protein
MPPVSMHAQGLASIPFSTLFIKMPQIYLPALRR